MSHEDLQSPSEYLSVAEAAHQLGISRQSFLRVAESGLVDLYHVAGMSKKLVKREDLEKLMVRVEPTEN